LTVYGWMTNPKIEYYIVESFGNFDPSAFSEQKFTSYSVDGSEYSLGKTMRYSMVPIGESNIIIYYAVRRNKRTSGSVNVADHFAAWRERGLKFGNHQDQIVAVEGYQSNGSSSVTVW
jgi:endo-1,4-beta-xylanase